MPRICHTVAQWHSGILVQRAGQPLSATQGPASCWPWGQTPRNYLALAAFTLPPPSTTSCCCCLCCRTWGVCAIKCTSIDYNADITPKRTSITTARTECVLWGLRGPELHIIHGMRSTRIKPAVNSTFATSPHCCTVQPMLLGSDQKRVRGYQLK